ncbi:MAG TPA: DUF6580 family putative transport protein [Luteimonas sp.]|nr:DUF6580 family putative transport protein [Luteimonas sp.]
MNRPRSDPSPAIFAPGPLLLAGLIVIAALTRLLPHPPNFSPVEAIALFGGAYFASKQWAAIVPLLAMLMADLALGALHGASYASYLGGNTFWSVYACIAISVVLGFGLRSKVSGKRVIGYSLAGSVLFFVVTNFTAWLSDPMYPKTAAGLAAAYIAGIPFFRWTVLGTLFYSALLFGGFALLRQRLPALREQTV